MIPVRTRTGHRVHCSGRAKGTTLCGQRMIGGGYPANGVLPVDCYWCRLRLVKARRKIRRLLGD